MQLLLDGMDVYPHLRSDDPVPSWEGMVLIHVCRG